MEQELEATAEAGVNWLILILDLVYQMSSKFGIWIPTMATPMIYDAFIVKRSAIQVQEVGFPMMLSMYNRYGGSSVWKM